MRFARIYHTSDKGGFVPEPENEQDLYPEDEYSHINRNSDTPLAYFLKFLLVISIFLFAYMYMTGKI